MIYRKLFLSFCIIAAWATLITLTTKNSQSVLDPIFVWVIITQIIALSSGILLLVLRLFKIIYATAFLYLLSALLNAAVWIFVFVDASRPGRHYSFWISFFPTILVTIMMLSDIFLAMTRMPSSDK